MQLATLQEHQTKAPPIEPDPHPGLQQTSTKEKEHQPQGEEEWQHRF